MAFRLYNSFGKKTETFKPVNPEVVSVFTCGPSVYQRAHIGNMRTFLYEDVLVRYLEYLGYSVKRGMNITDVEDKAIIQAGKEKISLKKLTDRNIAKFVSEMKILCMKEPDYLPRASEHVERAADIIQTLLDKGIAYRHGVNIYFDPLKFRGFGKLFDLDMTKWPKTRRRFHKDTYPGIQWNFGDFVLWHGYMEGDTVYWDTKIGRGRPSWNVQDPSMVAGYFKETLSIYCGGIDNLYRHHDYALAILESVKPYKMARYWLHGRHLLVDGLKMSKSKGNIVYVGDLLSKGYSAAEARFFLIYGHYVKRQNFSYVKMEAAAVTLRDFKKAVAAIRRRAGRATAVDSAASALLQKTFSDNMDNDLNVKAAFDGLRKIVTRIDAGALCSEEAAGIVKSLKKIDDVLKVIF
jgi:cysteinyl-tRNA synthetase